ncbi:Protein-lysine N-methyltransferase efm5 [Zalaria obscura]|uniref:Protein-lysine N-methyltransferase efm5 n=1 Tax=Zalaria obscura TaxID=2024903 RepID=A0ACC3SPG4_9PEZI
MATSMDDFDAEAISFTRQLPTDTLNLLHEFYRERDDRAKQFEDLKTKAEDDYDSKQLSMELFTEDWNASQFWYNDKTAVTLAEQLLDGATSETSIAVVSAPSVYIQLRNLLNDREKYPSRPTLRLLEYDDRFAVFKDDFVPYDFMKPLRLDPSMKGAFDRIICDPPFLSDDCQTKAALTVRWLAKTWDPASSTIEQRLILCTGERMETLANKLYAKTGLRTTTFYPEHSKGLSNEFRVVFALATHLNRSINMFPGEIPSMKLFESDKTFAFLDINPLSYGHALIIPKHHGAKLTDIPDDQLHEILSVTKKIAKASGAENYNILQNNGRLAHQVVDHVHFHMIPKPNEEEGLGISWPQQQVNKDRLQKLMEEIKSKM